jgi:hypothetical protein
MKDEHLKREEEEETLSLTKTFITSKAVVSSPLRFNCMQRERERERERRPEAKEEDFYRSKSSNSLYIPSHHESPYPHLSSSSNVIHIRETEKNRRELLFFARNYMNESLSWKEREEEEA